MILIDQMHQPIQTLPHSEEKKPGVMLPADLIRRVKSAAALQGITLKQYIAEALEAKLQAEVVSTER
jgi:predicted DNA binding CopG/RHH family protein